MIKIYTEGSSDKTFLTSLCEYLNIETEIFVINGNNIAKYLNLIQSDLNDERINRICIIMDSDKDFNQTKENIKYALKDVYNNIELFLLPYNKIHNEYGELETLLRKIAKYPKYIQCFYNYIKCLGKDIKEKEINKSMIYAYEQACKGRNKKETLLDFYNLNSLELNPLIDFLKK